MVDREVNPLEQRHLALSARFKSAWAFHQLLIGMQRMNAGSEYENRSRVFQSVFSRLKGFSDSLDESSSTEIGALEREVDALFAELIRQEQGIAPSEMRKFFSQVRALDDRILIEVVRFYLEIQKDQDWPLDRLDKTDFLLSRLAEKIAGPDLQSDQRRLDKVLQGLLSSAAPPQIPDKELEGLIGTLQDLRSEVRWVKTFEELSESKLVEVYRALKHDMTSRIFHSKILPLVVAVNNAFRRKIDELRNHEELRLVEEYQQLSQLQERSRPQAAELQAELTILQEQVERFRDRAKSNDVRLTELVKLGDSLRDVSSRLSAEGPGLLDEPPSGIPLMPWAGGNGSGSRALLPDLECLEPYWSDLLKALSGLSDDMSEEQATRDSSLLAFRLDGREILAFRRTVGAEPVDVGLEQFVLAAAALRNRVGQDVEGLRGLQGGSAGTTLEEMLRQARETARMGDAYVKHFSHLTDQAVFDGDLVDARDFQGLQARLLREWSGLVILLRSVSGSGDPKRVGSSAASPFGNLDQA